MYDLFCLCKGSELSLELVQNVITGWTSFSCRVASVTGF